MGIAETVAMTTGLLIRGVILAAGLGAVAVIFLTMLHFLRRPDLVKAKMFLNYPRFSRRFLLIVAFAFVAEGFTYVYTITGNAPPPTFESWGGFVQNQTLTMVVAVVIGAGLLKLWRMIR